MSSRTKILFHVNKYTIIGSDIIGFQNGLNNLEVDRNLKMLRNIILDEVCLQNSIDLVEAFHRNMFVLSNAENTPADAKNKSSNYGNMRKFKHSSSDQDASTNQPGCSVIEPDSLENRIESSIADQKCSMNQPESSGIEPDNWMNEQESSMAIFNFPKEIFPNLVPESGFDESHDIKDETHDIDVETHDIDVETHDIDVETHDIDVETRDIKNESPDIKDESYYWKNELCDTEDESDYWKNELYDCQKESYYMKNESCDMKDESNDSKEVSTDIKEELIKNALLDLLADEESEITELVLHLIFTFSCFQRSVRETETSVSQLGKNFTAAANEHVRVLLKKLRRSVSYLDTTLCYIHSKYFEMLERI